jgi:hypothetical protein
MENRVFVLSLYRQFLRKGRSFAETSPNHALYVLGKTKHEFKKGVTLSDPQEIEFAIALASTYLESLSSIDVDEGLGKHRQPKATKAPLDPFSD